jgi:hypothetical protein
MSAPGPYCVVCGRVALGLNGWDGGFPSYRQFRAVWDPPHVFQDMIHFTCLRVWEHREEMLAELVDLATDSTLEWDIELGGKTHRATRSGLGYTEQLLKTDNFLILQHNFDSRWLIIDFTGSWQFIRSEIILGLIHGETLYAEEGIGQNGIKLSPPPAESAVVSWNLNDLLRYLDIDDRYPGLTQSNAALKLRDYNPRYGQLEYTVRHPLSIPPTALAYFRDRYERDGESAFDALGVPSED